MSENNGEMEPQHGNLEKAPHSNERLAFFSDGVFAITITLLVLEIKVPEIAENLVATELPKEMLHLLPKIFSHIISFIILGIYWIAHHNIFMHIKRHDRILLWLNTIFLMCIASLPFPTGLLGQYHEHQIPVLAYAGTLFVTGISLDVLWWYATTRKMVDDEIDSHFVAFVHRYNRIAPVIYLISIGVSFFNLAIAKFLFIAVAIFYIVPNSVGSSLDRRHHRQIFRRFNE
jgi:uncharacterized membrane protein